MTKHTFGQLQTILLETYVTEQARHTTPGMLTTPYAQEVRSLGEKIQSVAKRFVAATEKSPVLCEKIQDEDDETEHILQTTLIQIIIPSVGEKFETPESVIPTKKAIKKLMLVLCGPLGLKPNPDSSAIDLMEIVSTHLRVRYKV